MSNNSRGVMKIPTAGFAHGARRSPRRSTTETGGIGYETITSMKGIEQMDLLDAQRSIVLARTGVGLNLSAVALPVRRLGLGRGLRSVARIARVSTALCAVMLAACSAVSTPEISLDLANPKQPSVIVRGLSRATLPHSPARSSPRASGRRSCASASPGTRRRWPGAYAVRDGALRFMPMFPLDPDAPTPSPSIRPAPGSSCGGESDGRALAAPPAQTAPVTVAAVYPTGPTVPATCCGCTSNSQDRWARGPGRTTSR